MCGGAGRGLGRDLDIERAPRGERRRQRRKRAVDERDRDLAVTIVRAATADPIDALAVAVVGASPYARPVAVLSSVAGVGVKGGTPNRIRTGDLHLERVTS